MNPVLGTESSMIWSCGIVVAEHPLLSSNFWIFLKFPIMGIQEHWVMLNEKKIDQNLSHTSNSFFFSTSWNNNPLDFKKENKKINRIEKPGSGYNLRSSSHFL